MSKDININDVLVSPLVWKIESAINPPKPTKAGELPSRRYHCVVMPGSSRSGKSWAILQYIIKTLHNSRRPLVGAVIRYRLTWIKISILPDFFKIMKAPPPWGFGIWNDKSYNKMDRVYTFDNGSTLKFIALADDAGEQMAHGLTTDIAYFNECIEISWSAVKQILMRNYLYSFLDFNPKISERHWIYEHVMKREDAITLHSTFRDNPYIPTKARMEIEGYEPTPENIKRGTADETYWKIYGLGIRSEIQGLIYPKFEIIEKLPPKLQNVCYGLDFGYTNDPTALVYKGEIEDCLYLDELLYKTGLVNLKSLHNEGQPSIEGEFEKLKIDRRIKIWADSAEQKTIKDLLNAGYNIEGAKKQGINYSIIDGINAVKRFKLFVTARSVHLIQELENYKWKENKDDSCKNEPVDKWNHILDGSRYCVIMSESYAPHNYTEPQIEVCRFNSASDSYDIWGTHKSGDDDRPINREVFNANKYDY